MGSYRAQVRFFGMADTNHMPIRRVMMRWDENGLIGMSPTALGFQKNRKPYCFDETASGNRQCLQGDAASIGMTCENNSDCSYLGGGYSCAITDSSFGNSSRACYEGYFNLHIPMDVMVLIFCITVCLSRR